jgi:hypothetical protein
MKGIANVTRRDLLTKFFPACAIACFASSKASSLTLGHAKSYQQEKHMFDLEYPKKLTYKQYLAAQYREYIRLARALEKEFGKEKTIELLKKFTTENLLQLGKAQAKEKTDLSLKAYTRQFNPTNYKNLLTLEIIEDTEKAYELKVSECIWATTFLDANAGDIGYAAVCYGDYAWAEGFNPKIKLVRDKTLMQGHEYCNHRYIWTG